MTAHIRTVTFDCTDPYPLAMFWSAVLGYTDDPDNPNDPDDPEALIVDPRGLSPNLLFIPVPEPKTVKNRVHLDLLPLVGRDEMVERVGELGGSIVADHRRDDGTGWVVMADLEGNELCIERSAAERPEWKLPVVVHRPDFEVRTADERPMLEAMLDWYRAGIVDKCEGVSQRHAAARPFTSETSICGIVKHLAIVEEWFAHDFAGQPLPESLASVDWEADRDWEFRTARDEPIGDLLDGYRVACDRSRVAAAGHDLGELGANPDGGPPFTLRFVYLHMIEETARHLGHLDILREHLDGTTGF